MTQTEENHATTTVDKKDTRLLAAKTHPTVLSARQGDIKLETKYAQNLIKLSGKQNTWAKKTETLQTVTSKKSNLKCSL